MDDSHLPYHLRQGSPALARCTACSRQTWSIDEVWRICAMLQPSGAICRGFFRAMTMPPELATPQWDEATKVHDWRNYVSDHVRQLWPTFNDEQKAALFAQAEDRASAEEWD